MNKPDKNPYGTETPEWQLWENMRSNELQSIAFNADAQRYLERSKAAREKSERYAEALAKLAEATHD